MITLKKIIILISFSLILLASNSGISYSEEIKNFKPRLSVKLSGGLSYMNGGDINTHLKSYDNYLSKMTNYAGGKIETLHHGSDLEGGLRWDINSKFALSVIIGYIYGKNKIYFNFNGPFPFDVPINNNQHLVISPMIKTTILDIGMYYTLPFRSRINIFIDSGLGYYFSKSILYKIHGSSSYGPTFIIYTKEEKFELSSKIFGFYGGIGLEYNIANNLALMLEVKGRYARANPQGKEISSWFDEPWTIEEGNLYIGERNLLYEGYGEYCPDLIFSESRPNGDEFHNIRKAVLDLSGFSLRAGIRIKLF